MWGLKGHGDSCCYPCFSRSSGSHLRIQPIPRAYSNHYSFYIYIILKDILSGHCVSAQPYSCLVMLLSFFFSQRTLAALDYRASASQPPERWDCFTLFECISLPSLHRLPTSNWDFHIPLLFSAMSVPWLHFLSSNLTLIPSFMVTCFFFLFLSSNLIHND